MKVYVGCSLTHSSQEAQSFVEEFKGRLGETHEILQFLGLTNGTAADVYSHDVANVEGAEAMIAFVHEPSIGLGMEIGIAITQKKPLLCLAPSGTRVTRMVLGAGELHLLRFQEYSSLEEALSYATAFLTQGSQSSVS